MSSTYIVDGYTETDKDEHIFRAHLCYSKKGCWYDWGYFNWQGYDNPNPDIIMMIIDLNHCEIIHEMDQDPDSIPGSAGDMVIPYLTR